MALDMSSSQGLALDTIPREVRLLAEALSRLHGPCVIRHETGGYHIYLPSPECLKTDGRKELTSKHLTVNASKNKGLPDWKPKPGKKKEDSDPDFSALCHKTNTQYRVSDLLNPRLYKPLADRGIPNVNSTVVSAGSQRTNSLEDDGKGHMVPIGPGTVTPIIALPPRHPAVEYLINRQYDLPSLYKQFECGFCTDEQPESLEKGIYYKKLPLDFRDTPQGRIVFFAYINNVRVGFQSRIIDKVEGIIKSYWHPYRNNWVEVEYKHPGTGKWEPIPGVEVMGQGYDLLWKPSKYKTAFGMPRNEVLMGVDAAVLFNVATAQKKPTAFLVEGPLDAGRIGPGGVAMLGKYLSERQADILTRKFKRLVIVADNDAAGQEAKQRIKTVLSSRNTEVVFADVPKGYKDIGEMPPAEANLFAINYLK